MALTLESAARLLDRHGLLREIIRGDVWTLDPHDIKGFDEPFSAITYDTRKVEPGTFLCCKGRFKAEYLQGIDERGLAAYVSENDFSDATQAPGLIVDDVRKAMALLSAEFYGRPQDQLKVVGITGTKGKTTTAYLTQAMLNGCSGGKCALFSSVDNCLDGHTYVESDLTTPESMDAFRMMREAVDNGMEYGGLLAGLQGGPRVRSHIRRGRVPQHQPGPYQPDRASDIRGLSPLQASDRQELPCPRIGCRLRARRPHPAGRTSCQRSRHHVRAWRRFHGRRHGHAGE